MSRLNDLIRQLATKDAALARDIEKEVKALADRRAFGLNFERHTPEAVDLPGRRPVVGSKVRILPPRGEMPKNENDRLWAIVAFDPATDPPVASMNAVDGSGDINWASIEDLVVVAEFNEPIYPGLVSTGKVERGGDKPYHSVINAENYHALQALLFTHRGKVDCIYIDPPYNTGAKDWKYNNDYVESDDLYRHSKWLAFMERRLLLAKELLNPDDSVLIVTIDEKEYLRLGLLLEQAFPEADIQMVSSVISSQASVRDGRFSRCDEYIYFVFLGRAVLSKGPDDMLNEGQSALKSQLWFQYVRTGGGNLRVDRPAMFFPIFISELDARIHSVGEPIPLTQDKTAVVAPEGTIAVWPETPDGREARWKTSPATARRRAEAGLLRAAASGRGKSGWSIMTVTEGAEKRIGEGEIVVDGYRPDGGAVLRELVGGQLRYPKTVWNKTSHTAGWHGTKLLSSIVSGRKFPFPKSLYAVEDALRFVIGARPQATVVDFFSGSGTTAHAVMRLNKQDNGRRRSISVTNNEVSADEQKTLRLNGLRPGDAEWEKHGICDYITKPRIAAAVTGRSPEGDPLEGNYKFTDEFPMADGFEENVEFFTLTYESPLRVEANYAFGRIAPLLWLRAGSQGRRIDDLPDGWDVAETYGVISDLDHTEEFAQAIAAAPAASVAFIITDEDRLFEALVRELPDHVEPVRLYEAYLRTFEIEARRAAER